jgi:hypothetical protein
MPADSAALRHAARVRLVNRAANVRNQTTTTPGRGTERQLGGLPRSSSGRRGGPAYLLHCSPAGSHDVVEHQAGPGQRHNGADDAVDAVVQLA